jgi:hypothetical protein
MRWEQGREVIDAMLKVGDLDRVTPSTDRAADLLSQARRHVTSARSIAGPDLGGAFQLAYDAGRKALCAILENQGLRATSQGGHVAVLEAVTAQLDPPMGKVLRPFGRLRRQRNKVEYAPMEIPPLTPEVVENAIAKAEELLDLGLRVLDQMSPY